MKIIELLKRFGRWVKHWFYDVPVSEPTPEEKYKLRMTDVAKEYMVITYHGQRINMHKTEYPMWKLSSRKDKRAMKLRFEKYEKEGLVRFIDVEGKAICVRDLDYEKRAEKLKNKK